MSCHWRRSASSSAGLAVLPTFEHYVTLFGTADFQRYLTKPDRPATHCSSIIPTS
jgi:hypothetical protein